MREDKKTWRMLQRKRATLFLGLCCFIFVKVVWMTFDTGSVSDADRLRHRSLYPFELNISEVLQVQLNYGTAISRNYTREDFSLALSTPARTRNHHLRHFNCHSMFNDNQTEMTRARDYMLEHPRKPVEDREYIDLTSDCENFRTTRGYIMRPLSRQEYEFPIAYSVLMYKDVEQIERLLRAIYMPQNYYCIHIDTKAQEVVHNAIRSIARCFPNVFVASRLESVYWGHISIIYAEMNCLRDLLNYKWKYFINLSGQMFPLQTNRDLVNILTLYDGANDIEGTYERSRQFWIALRQWFSWKLYESLDTMMITIYPKSQAPHNVTIYKGSNQVAMSRAFAIYFMHSKIARDITTWFEDTLAPDEYIWPTINHNAHLHAPGAYKGDPETKTFTARATIWKYFSSQLNWSWKNWDCQGKWVRQICIFGVGDLPWLYKRPELFVNKFHRDFEPLAYDCLEELIFNRTMKGDQLTFDPTYYENLPFVKYKELVITTEEAVNMTGGLK